MSRRAYVLITLLAFALVLLPFLFWYDTWFGRRLTDAQIDSYLRDSTRPRHAQHALVQIGERLGRGDHAVRRWYPNVIELAAAPQTELRQTAAWIMGQDREYEPFHPVLLGMLDDPALLVRRNAALSLAALRDPAARPVLREMLAPFTVPAPVPGRVAYRLQVGEYVNSGTLLAHIGGTELRSPAPGEVRALVAAEGSTVGEGQSVLELAPDDTHAWEALRALYLVGSSEDLDALQHFARTDAGTRPELQRQAMLTIAEIRNRAR